MIGRNNSSQHLAKQFEIQTLGRRKHYLGIEKSHKKGNKNVTDLLKETHGSL